MTYLVFGERYEITRRTMIYDIVNQPITKEWLTSKLIGLRSTLGVVEEGLFRIKRLEKENLDAKIDLAMLLFTYHMNTVDAK